MTLVVDRSPRAPNRLYCKYCNSWVDNNEKDVKTHNNYIDHQMNVKKWKTRKEIEQRKQTLEKKKIDKQIDEIQARAMQEHQLKDVLKIDKNIEREDEEKRRESFDLARYLYGDDILNQMTQPKKQPIDKTKLFNDYISKVPTKVRAIYREKVDDFDKHFKGKK